MKAVSGKEFAKLLKKKGWELKRVDFSLRHSNVNKAFIEVKKIGEDLEKHQEQLLNYSFQEGVKLSILTNGITW